MVWYVWSLTLSLLSLQQEKCWTSWKSIILQNSIRELRSQGKTATTKTGEADEYRRVTASESRVCRSQDLGYKCYRMNEDSLKAAWAWLESENLQGVILVGASTLLWFTSSSPTTLSRWRPRESCSISIWKRREATIWNTPRTLWSP